jgi:hypothetical protein
VEVFQPHGRVGVPEILDDVQQRMETHRERRLPDPFCECLWAIGVRA